MASNLLETLTSLYHHNNHMFTPNIYTAFVLVHEVPLTIVFFTNYCFRFFFSIGLVAETNQNIVEKFIRINSLRK